MHLAAASLHSDLLKKKAVPGSVAEFTFPFRFRLACPANGNILPESGGPHHAYPFLKLRRTISELRVPNGAFTMTEKSRWQIINFEHRFDRGARNWLDIRSGRPALRLTTNYCYHICC